MVCVWDTKQSKWIVENVINHNHIHIFQSNLKYILDILNFDPDCELWGYYQVASNMCGMNVTAIIAACDETWIDYFIF